MKEILNNILNALENVTASVDALESVLIQRGLVRQGDVEGMFDEHRNKAQLDLVHLRSAVGALEF
jgi:hypothetical protein